MSRVQVYWCIVIDARFQYDSNSRFDSRIDGETPRSVVALFCRALPGTDDRISPDSSLTLDWGPANRFACMQAFLGRWEIFNFFFLYLLSPNESLEKIR